MAHEIKNVLCVCVCVCVCGGGGGGGGGGEVGCGGGDSLTQTALENLANKYFHFGQF